MNLTEGSIAKHIKELAMPASIGFFFNTMFNVVDTFFAGQISTDAIASLSISFPIFFLIIALDNGISVGSSALISNALGEGDKKSVKVLTAQAFSFGILISFVVAIVGLSVSPSLFRILGASGEYLELALSYINIIFLGAPFFVLNAAGNAILIAHGNSKTMRNVLILSFFLNCILDPWFLYGGFGVPAMGLKGIAVATITSMFIADLLVLRKLWVSGHLTGLVVKNFIPLYLVFIAILRQSLPAAMNMMSIALGIFVTTYYVKGFGSDAVAAFGIGMRVQQIFLLPTIGLTIATISITGQNNGAGRYERIQETIKISLKYGIRIMTVGAILLLLFPNAFMRIFTDDPLVTEVGVEYIRIAAISSWAYMIMAAYNSALQGMKRPNFPFLISALRQTIVPFIVFYIVIDQLEMGLLSIWISILLITWSAAIIVVLYARKVLRDIIH